MFGLITKIINFLFTTFSVWVGTPKKQKMIKKTKKGIYIM